MDPTTMNSVEVLVVYVWLMVIGFPEVTTPEPITLG